MNEKHNLKAGCSVFNAGCNEQVFSSKPWKKFHEDPSCRFQEKCTPIPKKWRHRAEVRLL